MSKKEDVFEKIEGVEYDVQVGAASGPQQFVHTVRQSSEFSTLLEKRSAREIVERLEALLARGFDRSKQHPHGVAILVYMIALIEKKAIHELQQLAPRVKHVSQNLPYPFTFSKGKRGFPFPFSLPFDIPFNQLSIIGTVLGVLGIIVIASANWRIALGLFMVLWANNLYLRLSNQGFYGN